MGIFPGRFRQLADELSMAFSQKVSKANKYGHIVMPIGSIFYFVVSF